MRQAPLVIKDQFLPNARNKDIVNDFNKKLGSALDDVIIYEIGHYLVSRVQIGRNPLPKINYEKHNCGLYKS